MISFFYDFLPLTISPLRDKSTTCNRDDNIDRFDTLYLCKQRESNLNVDGVAIETRLSMNGGLNRLRLTEIAEKQLMSLCGVDATSYNWTPVWIFMVTIVQ